MATEVKHERTRDPVRTQRAILDAAEDLFIARGYRGTSLEDVAAAAGFSRGTPGYFFRSKRQLYRAVVDRIFRRADDFFAERGPSSEAAASPEAALPRVVSACLEFLAAEPAIALLLYAEGGPDGGDPAKRLLELVNRKLAVAGVEPRPELVLSIVSLCCFPVAFADAVADSLELDVRTPAGRAAHVNLVSKALASGLHERN